MADPSPIPPASTFIVRFWRESSAVGSRWRARIEHLQSGESASSLNLQGISDFMRRLGIRIENAHECGDSDE